MKTTTKTQFTLTALLLTALTLQALDYLTTAWVISTGLGEEKNQLILQISSLLGAQDSVMPAVLLVKLIVAAVLIWALKTTKPTGAAVAAAGLFVGFYGLVVSLNLYWFFALTGLA